MWKKLLIVLATLAGAYSAGYAISIAFDDTSITKKSLRDAGTIWNETATATPSTGTKVTYSVSGGNVNLIDINKDSGAIIHTFGLKNADNYNYFSVNSNTGEIQSVADLSATADIYRILVTVNDTWSTKKIPLMINVGVAAAENLKFYETSAAINMISEKRVKLTDTNVKAFATVKGRYDYA